jgi:predicted ATPase/DNA-binding SARP family transcriptional activator/DNA-binding CsgD family transcriptional regulator
MIALKVLTLVLIGQGRLLMGQTLTTGGSAVDEPEPPDSSPSSRSHDPQAEAGVLSIYLLGGFHVKFGAHVLAATAWRSRKAAQLVKLLALAPDHSLHREQLLDRLWPDLEPSAGANNLRYTLHVARRLLGRLPLEQTDLLRWRGERIVLAASQRLWIDAEAFTKAAAAVRRAQEPAAYWSAIDLYTGELLPEERYEDWAIEHRETLRGTYLSLLDDVAQLHEANGDYHHAIVALQRLVQAEPAHEDAHVKLMEIYALTDQRRQALRQYRKLEVFLRRELDSDPDPATQSLQQEILASCAAAPTSIRRGPRAPSTPRTNLPHALTNFVGRERDVAEVTQLLSKARLVTLTGAGGSGKTRLALESSRLLLAKYRDGVWMVRLAPLRDPTLVPAAIAQTLGLPEAGGKGLQGHLIAQLREAELLLVLDNCEQVLAAAPVVADLLAACPKVTVLTTSRSRLRVSGEHEVVVQPLELPDAEQSDLVQLTQNPAIALFIARAQAVKTGFALTPANAGAVVGICQRLDGLPLGIELAAAQMHLLTPCTMFERLALRLPLLTNGARDLPARHQMMRETIAWSYNLLTGDEQRIFRRLAIFTGGWTLDAAEAVAGEVGLDVLERLSTLVEHSLVRQIAPSDAPARFKMLETIREYGLEQLAVSGEGQTMRQRHAAHFVALAAEAEPLLSRADHSGWLERLDAEQDNFRLTLEWALMHDPELGLHLAGSLCRFWFVRGHWSEGRRWLEQVLAVGTTNSSERAKALLGAGQFALCQGDFFSASAFLSDARASYNVLGDQHGVAAALTNLGYLAAFQLDHVQLATIQTELMALLPTLSDQRTIAFLLLFLGFVPVSRGEFRAAFARHEESLEIFQELGDQQGIVRTQGSLGLIAIALGELDRARALLQKNLELSWQLHDVMAIQYALVGFGLLAGSERQPVRAARLLGAAEALRETVDLHIPAMLCMIYDHALAQVRGQLQSASFAAVWTAGRALPLETAVTEALEGARRLQGGGPALELSAPLTRREREVSGVVAQGRTNRQIGVLLGITERTVETHVGNILHKLGADSRHQVVTWVQAQEPPVPEWASAATPDV